MWTTIAGGQAEEPPTPEQLQQWRSRMSPPENELPVDVGLTVMLGRSDDTAVGITQFQAFSTGFLFTLAVRVRRLPPELAHGGLFTLVGYHPMPGIDIPLERRLLLGLEYPDGRRASTLRMPTPGPGMDDGHRLALVQHGGNGGSQGVDQAYWVTPLPPEGPVTFVLAWPEFGLPESRTVVDSAAIRSAAERSHVLWPPQPDMAPELPPPPRPSSGWFAYGE